MPSRRLKSLLAAFVLAALVAPAAPAHGRHATPAAPGAPPHASPPPSAPARSCGVGTLGFDPAVEIAPAEHPGRPARVFVNLLDGDANPDVGVARGAELQSALGDGHGGFERLAPITVGHPSQILYATSADFDDDGVNDALLSDALRKRSVLTVAGTASGRLAGERRAVFLGGHAGPRGAVAGDWNGDGRADVATRNALTRSLTVLTHEEDGSWSREQVRLPFLPVDLLAADVDGDGAPDLVAGSAAGNLRVLLNRDGHFGDTGRTLFMHTLFLHKGWGRGPGASIDVADLNRDGVPDLLSLRSDGRLAVRLAEPPSFASSEDTRGEAFQDPLEARLDCRGGSEPARTRSRWSWISELSWNWKRGWGLETGPCHFAGLAVGDVDRDGTADLVATTPRAARDVQVLFGRGDGTFDPGFSLRTPGGLGSDLRLADVNGDGRLDPIVGADNGAAFALPSRCDCRPPYEGPACEACSGPRCPVGGDVLARQLSVGPPEIVRLGARLVGTSLEDPTDLRAAAAFAQSLAALTLESDIVVVAMPTGDRNAVIQVGGSPVPKTITTFEVQEVLKGAVRGVVEVSQEGGFLDSGERQDSSDAQPFPSADDLALCPAAPGARAEATTSPYWILFLRAGSALYSLIGEDLGEPAQEVEMLADGFVLRDASGLVLPVSELAGLPASPDGGRAP